MSEKRKVSCLQCGATNNFPLDHGGKKIVCGRCKTALPVPGTLIQATGDQAITLMERSSLPVLIDFHSDQCAPCHMMHPIVEALARRRSGELMVIQVNTDIYPDIASAFRIQGVPTFVVLHKGTERARTSGAMAETDFSFWVASVA